jgi:TonB family protein
MAGSVGVIAIAQQSAAKFVPADVLSTSEIGYPVNTTATGLVTVVLSLASSGQVQQAQVSRDVPPLTAAVQSALQKWSFKAAVSNGQPVSSQLPVNVVFNPYNPGGTEIVKLSAGSPAVTPGGRFVPVDIAAASYALYPPDSLATGTVVLAVTVNRRGQAQGIRVVRDVAALTPAASDAVKAWNFKPASLDGQPVSGKVIIAFVFQRNLS